MNLAFLRTMEIESDYIRVDSAEPKKAMNLMKQLCQFHGHLT